jgi:serine/threonine protein phosphatase PrpC
MDASELPKELLATLEELAMLQLMPDGPENPADAYRGPVALLKEAYEATESLGSTTVILAVLDNSTRIHGKLHPMIAVLSIGDCELILLRRTEGKKSDLSVVFHTEMQRIDGHCQTPLQLARVDERIDADFDEAIALEVIERGSAVHCVSAYEGDVLVLGSDGVFDNLFLGEVVDIVNGFVRPRKGGNCVPAEALEKAAKQIVASAHMKSEEDAYGGYPDTPIGRGGKIDDTSVVVAEVVEWTQAHRDILAQVRRNQRWRSMAGCGVVNCSSSGGGQCGRKCGGEESDDDAVGHSSHKNPAHMPVGSEIEEESTDEEDDHRCAIT